MRSLVALALTAVLGCWCLVRNLPEGEAEAEPISGRPQEVQSVAIDGHGDLPIAVLRTVLSTHVGDQLDEAKLAHDRAALEAALVARGYLDAKVERAEIMFDSGGAAFVMFAVKQGRLFHVRSVTVVGAALRDSGVVTIAAGEAVMADRLERARDALSDRLAVRGKSAAVTTNVHVDEAAAVVDVELAAR